MPARTYDAIIIGGGIVGASLALALGKKQRRVLLVEKQLRKEPPIDPLEARTLALSYSSYFIYSALGITKVFQGASPIKQVRVNVQGQFGSCRFDHRHYHTKALGYVVGAHDLGRELIQALQQCAMVEIREGEFPTEGILLGDRWQIGEVGARLLIACDGMDSPWRESQRITCEERDYQHHAIVLNIKMRGNLPGVALERFLPQGAIALLPWQEGATCVWTLPPEKAAFYMQQDEESFKEHCQQAFGNQFGRIEQLGKRHCVPLKMVRTKIQSTSRFLLMGNAAHSLHPIAAQGLNLSLRDIWQFYEKLDRDYSEEDMGSLEFLENYAHARKRDQQRVITSTDRIARWMVSGKIPAWTQAWGMTVWDSLSPFKHRFVRRSMGMVS